MITEAHKRGIFVMVDININHVAPVPDNNGTEEY
jgi:glycosidase